MKKENPKTTYRIRNWSEYTTALTERGNIFLWISPDVRRSWFAPATKRPGRPLLYSDILIQAAGALRSVLRFPLRATEGCMRSLLDALRLDLPVPDFSTLSRRFAKLSVQMPIFSKKEPLHVVVDSTGLKVYGEGEWKVRQHGISKRRTWRKLHLAVDADTMEIVAVEMTGNEVHDSEVFDELIGQIPGEIASVAGDGAYDTRWCHRELARRRIHSLLVPRRNAQRWKTKTPGSEERNAMLERIAQIGRQAWKHESGYHRRSLAETTMFRLKTLFGDRLASRRDERQRTESILRAYALNIFTRLGMPTSYPISSA